MKKRLLISLFIFVTPTLCFCEISIYQSTDNAGQNKRERIDSVEKYLIDLSQSLRLMDSKIDENAKKMKSVEDSMKQLNDLVNKKDQVSEEEKKTLAPQKARVEKTEMDKLKEDILVLKNKDIEKLKVDFDELRENVKRLESKEKMR